MFVQWEKLVDHSSELEQKRTFMSFDRYYEINVYNLSRPLAEKNSNNKEIYLNLYWYTQSKTQDVNVSHHLMNLDNSICLLENILLREKKISVKFRDSKSL